MGSAEGLATLARAHRNRTPPCCTPRCCSAWAGRGRGHIHEFVVGRERYGPKDMDQNLDLDLDHIVNEEGVALREMLGAWKTFIYVYDFGDD